MKTHKIFLFAIFTISSVANGQSISSSTAASTPAPTSTIQPEYVPGKLNVREMDMYLSQGLTVRVIAIAGQNVQYWDGTQSSDVMHAQPDGAAVFADDTINPGGWIYVSNSEVDENNGGVGAFYFDRNGNLMEYKMLLTGSKRNCNGGKTQWNTWISCEEDTGGKVWQIDPLDQRNPVQITHGSQGGYWESFAHDIRDPTKLYAFLTEDSEDGAVQRMTINNPNYTDPWNILLGSGPVDYLLLEPADGCRATSGTFRWITDEAAARSNALLLYPETEGMEMIPSTGTLRIISKSLYGMFHLDLDAGTYSFESTAFDGQPDQSTTVHQENGDKLVYLTEEASPIAGVLGAQVGIWTRDQSANYVNIIQGRDWSSETTGIGFSPDGMHMYFAYQSDGYVFDVTRTDGLSLFGPTAPGGCSALVRAMRAVSASWSSFRSWMFPSHG